MKTKEELNALKEEVETLNKKLAELSEDELKQITGGQNVMPVIFAGTKEVDEQIISGFVPKTEPVMSPSGESSPFDCNGYFFKLD